MRKQPNDCICGFPSGDNGTNCERCRLIARINELEDRMTPDAIRHFDADDLIMSTAAYYLGRSTINVGDFCQRLRRAWPELSGDVRAHIQRLVESQFAREGVLRRLYLEPDWGPYVTQSAQPQPGQYWQTQDGKLRVYVHGVTQLGTVLAEMPSGQWVDIDVNQMLADWRHLPGCDSFDWQPTRYPRYFETHNRENYAFLRQDSATDFVLVQHDGTGREVTEVTLADRVQITETEAMSRIVSSVPEWPKYVTNPTGWACDTAYLRRDSEEVCVRVTTSGVEHPNWWDEQRDETVHRGTWKYITEAEAKSRIEPPKPVESPDDWVTQDRVVPRNNIDLWCWIEAGKTPHEHDWQKGVSNFHRHKHGDREYPSCSEILHVRCRRKDLPPVEPPKPATRTITFCEYIVWDEPGCERLVWALESDDMLYRHSYPTGQTRTVEVPE
jgi:hypothetical protein